MLNKNKYMYIVVKFPNDDTFHVPANVIADHRTNYYAEKDGFVKGSKEWDDEFKQSCQSYELIDWIGNCMEWSDFKEHAVKQPAEIYDDKYYSDTFKYFKIVK